MTPKLPKYLTTRKLFTREHAKIPQIPKLNFKLRN